jgi:septal ring factor EnvC (AmiA/AmiB activator)
MEKEIAEIKQRLATVEQKIENQCEKCAYVTKDVNSKIKETSDILEGLRTLSITVTKLTEQIKYNSQEVTDMKTKLEAVSSRPAEKWDKLTGAIIAAATSGIVSLLASLIL